MVAVRNALSDPDVLDDTIRELVDSGDLDTEKVDPGGSFGFLIQDNGAEGLIDAAYRFCRHEPTIDTALTGTASRGHLVANIRLHSNHPFRKRPTASQRTIRAYRFRYRQLTRRVADFLQRSQWQLRSQTAPERQRVSVVVDTNDSQRLSFLRVSDSRQRPLLMVLVSIFGCVPARRSGSIREIAVSDCFQNLPIFGLAIALFPVIFILRNYAGVDVTLVERELPPQCSLLHLCGVGKVGSRPVSSSDFDEDTRFRG